MRAATLLLGALAIAAATVAVTGAGATGSATVALRATLRPQAEIPKATGKIAEARGSFTATLDPDAKTLKWTVTFSGLTGQATDGHVHSGGPMAQNSYGEIRGQLEVVK